MIVNDKDAVRRLNSPLNLINKLKEGSNGSRKSAMSLFIPPRTAAPEIKLEPLESLIKVEKVEVPKPQVAFFNPFEKQHQPQELPAEIPIPSKLEDILENSEAQIQLGLAHDKALKLLNRSVGMLETKLDDIKADRLPQVVTAASKVVESIRRERNEASKNNKDREVHYHFYVPQQKKISDFEVIDVG